MICLTKLLYWEATGKHLKCADCLFFKTCDAEAKDGDGDGGEPGRGGIDGGSDRK